MRRRLSVVLFFAAAFGVQAPAAAQAPDPEKASAAQALFDQATEEMEKRSFASACPRLEEATRLIPEALGARMALAECYEGLGRLASAWSQYAMVEGLATKAGQTERAETAGKRAAELKPKLATLTIELASGVDAIAGLTITRDGLDVGPGQRGVALPADVGSHRILVAAPGYRPWKKTIEILADGARTTVKVPMLIVDATAAPGSSAVHHEAVRPWQLPLSIGSMAVGGVGLAVGGVLGGLAISRNRESNRSECNAYNQCTGAGIALRNQALALGTGSTVSFIVGGVFAAGGVVLTLTAPSRAQEKAPQRAGAAATMALEANVGGIKLEGTW